MLTPSDSLQKSNNGKALFEPLLIKFLWVKKKNYKKGVVCLYKAGAPRGSSSLWAPTPSQKLNEDWMLLWGPSRGSLIILACCKMALSHKETAKCILAKKQLPPFSTILGYYHGVYFNLFCFFGGLGYF